MKALACLCFGVASLSAAFLAIPVAGAAEPVEHAMIGPGQGQVTQTYSNGPRDGAIYAEHCDGTFENAYAWWNSGQGDPYYGGFAERFDVGPGQVEGIRTYLTTSGWYNPELTQDLFVWGHGVDGGPGTVLGIAPAVHVDPPAVWPNISAHDYQISAGVGITFYVGCQANWPWEDHVWWFNAVDLNGPVIGEPWTCILPGIGYPAEGWQDVDIVWGDDAHSMGLGVYYVPSGVSGLTGPPPVRVSSWGGIKNLYAR